MEAPIIELKNVKKSFGDLEVLKDINVSVGKGEVIVLIGPSGSGKSTLLRSITSLETIQGGSIEFHGKPIALPGKKSKSIKHEKVRQQIGMVFQHFNLFPHMNVTQNLMLAPVELKKATKEEAKERAIHMLKKVGMDDKAEAYPEQLSGGQKQRVAIARAIALNPQYLFCDEPNSGLDPKTSLVIDELIHDITTEYNMTTIINTHDMNSVMGIGDSILYIYQGHKEWEGTKDNVFTATNERLNNFIFASDLLRKVREVEEHRK